MNEICKFACACVYVELFIEIIISFDHIPHVYWMKNQNFSKYSSKFNQNPGFGHASSVTFKGLYFSQFFIAELFP